VKEMEKWGGGSEPKSVMISVTSQRENKRPKKKPKRGDQNHVILKSIMVIKLIKRKKEKKSGSRRCGLSKRQGGKEKKSKLSSRRVRRGEERICLQKGGKPDPQAANQRKTPQDQRLAEREKEDLNFK